MSAIVVFLDQLLKWYLLGPFDLAGRGRVPVTFFFDLTLVWNRGISYGLLQQGVVGRWILVGLTIVAVVILLVWMSGMSDRMSTAGIGLIVGGALGNLIDRILYGAVVDFISLHVAGFHWYVFNLADCAIVTGVAGILYKSAFDRSKTTNHAS